MDLTRALTALCLFLVSVCLVFCFCAIFSLRHTLNEVALWRTDMQETVTDIITDLDSEQTQADEKEEIAVDVLYDSFCVRNVEGKIGIYTSDGYLIRIVDIPVALLPIADQEALQSGISLTSWKEVLALIADFGG